jgi:hypothetical protein
MGTNEIHNIQEEPKNEERKMKGKKKRKVVVTILVVLVFLIILGAISSENDTNESATFKVGSTVYLCLNDQEKGHGEPAIVTSTDTDFVLLLSYIKENNEAGSNKLLRSGRAFSVDWGTPAQVLDKASHNYKGKTLLLYKLKILSGKHKDRICWAPEFECKPTYYEPNLELVGWMNGVHFENVGFGYGYIVGSIRNNTDHRYNYVQVSFSLYDRNGNRIGTALANTSGLGPGETWRFKAPVIDADEVSSYDFEEIVAW